MFLEINVDYGMSTLITCWMFNKMIENVSFMLLCMCIFMDLCLITSENLLKLILRFIENENDFTLTN